MEGKITALGSNLEIQIIKKFVKDKNEPQSVIGATPVFALAKVVQASNNFLELQDKNVVVKVNKTFTKDEQVFVDEDDILYEDNE